MSLVLRKGVQESVPVRLLLTTGLPATGIAPASVLNGQATIVYPDHTTSPITLSAAGGGQNWFEIGSGLYHLIIPGNMLTQVGQIQIIVMPIVSLPFSGDGYVASALVTADLGTPQGASLSADLLTALNHLVDIKGSGWQAADNLHVIQPKTAALPASPAAVSDITAARDAIRGGDNRSITDIAGAGYTSGDDLHSAATRQTAIKTQTDKIPASPASQGDVTTARDDIQNSISVATGIDVSQNGRLVDSLNSLTSRLQTAELRGR